MKNTQNTTTESLVNARMRDDAAKASAALEEIMQDKCAKKIKTTLENIDK